MDKFSRSKSTREGRAPPSSMHDLRSYSTASYSGGYPPENPPPPPTQLEVQVKKSKNKVAASSSSKSWSFSDPELQRKKRVASYKVYAMEGKMKGSLRKSFRWIKDHVVHGWW